RVLADPLRVGLVDLFSTVVDATKSRHQSRPSGHVIKVGVGAGAMQGRTGAEPETRSTVPMDRHHAEPGWSEVGGALGPVRSEPREGTDPRVGSRSTVTIHVLFHHGTQNGLG